MALKKDRLPLNEVEWIEERIAAREEFKKDWASFLGMKLDFFSKIIHRDKHLPDKYREKYAEMLEILKEDKEKNNGEFKF